MSPLAYWNFTTSSAGTQPIAVSGTPMPGAHVVISSVRFQEPAQAGNRTHVDIRLRDKAQLDEPLRLGATAITDHDGWQVLSDPEGNKFCASTRTD